MTRSFAGKVVIVTGSSSGIGEGIVILFAKLGAQVVVTGRSRENVARVAQLCQAASPNKLKALEVVADIGNDDEAKNVIDSTISEFGKLDVLVNNAGAGWLHTFLDENFMEVYEKNMRIDLRSAVFLTHTALPYLEKSKGNVVNISSVGGKKPMPQSTAYCIAKSGLDMFTRCLAVELGPKGIRVNGINPGFVATNLYSRAGASKEVEAGLTEFAKSVSPLGAVGQPVDIGYSVAFLASDEASFITGINMSVDGGALVK